MWPQVAVVAGVVATALFVVSTLPMLIKAARTKDLSSYSGSNLVIANTGNAAQALYVITLPPGPVWALHTFNTAASALMLIWWIRHRERNSHTKAAPPGSPAAKAARAGKARPKRVSSPLGSGAGLDNSGVAKSYRPVLRDQPMLLPVDMGEWLPPDHLVWFVLETVDAAHRGARFRRHQMAWRPDQRGAR